MPIVRIEMLAGRTAALKARLAEDITAVVARHCQSDPAHIYVIFNDVQHQDWAVAGRVFPTPAPDLSTVPVEEKGG